jgi:hypothetical protein
MNISKVKTLLKNDKKCRDCSWRVYRKIDPLGFNNFITLKYKGTIEAIENELEQHPEYNCECLKYVGDMRVIEKYHEKHKCIHWEYNERISSGSKTIIEW